MTRRLSTLAVCLGGALVLSLGGCTSLGDLPLPGGAPSGPSYVVTAEFTDVLDLVPQSAVKVNDVTVGSVEKIWLDGWTARVRMRVSTTVHLPDNATAAVQQSSLLGEKFVALAAPQGETGQGELSDGDVIPLERTRRSVEVEELLGALGLLLNGGGLAQLRTINEELAAALTGHEADAKDALHQLDTFIGGLEAQKADLVRAIDALDRLSARLAAQKETIGAAVDALGPGLAVLAEQRQQLTGALTALGDLGAVGTRVIGESRDDTVATIAALRPTLDQLVKAGDALPKALDFLLTFPFPPNVGNAIVGDRVNLHITIDANAADILANLLAAAPPAAGGPTVPNLPIPPLPIPLPIPLPSPSLLIPLPSLPLPSISLPIPLPSIGLPLGNATALEGQPIARGSAPAGAADGVQGGFGDVLSGGLSA
jgi:phospholipid/cholesterol/gamma-HCH transport system substrate-binding protein